MNNLSRVCLLLVVASLMLTFTSHAALIKGKTTVSSGAIAGIVVVAYPAEALTFDGPAPHSSKTTVSSRWSCPGGGITCSPRASGCLLFMAGIR